MDSSANHQRIRGNIRHWLGILIAAALLWRLLNTLLNFPIWSDEAFLGINLLNRNYAQLLQPLWHNQVAPILYLFLEKWILTGSVSSPIAGKNGIAILIFPLAILGAVRVWRRNSPAHVLMLCLPFLFTFIGIVAAVYAGARVTNRLRRFGRIFVPRAVAVVLLAFLAYATGAMIVDIQKNDLAVGARDVRNLGREIFTPQFQSIDQVVIFPNVEIPPVLEWYVRTQPQLATPRGILNLNGNGKESFLRQTHAHRLWIIAFHPDPPSILPSILSRLGDPKIFNTLTTHTNALLKEGSTTRPYDYCDVAELNLPPTAEKMR